MLMVQILQVDKLQPDQIALLPDLQVILFNEAIAALHTKGVVVHHIKEVALQ
jgi:hypothetical protein